MGHSYMSHNCVGHNYTQLLVRDTESEQAEALLTASLGEGHALSSYTACALPPGFQATSIYFFYQLF